MYQSAMTKKAKIYGQDIKDIRELKYTIPASLESDFELVKCIEVSSMRSKNQPVEFEFKDNDLLALRFTDDTEWIGHPVDIQEIYDEKTLKRHTRSEHEYVFESQISTAQDSRGFIKNVVVKVFSVFRPKKLGKVSMEALGLAYDKKVQPNPGLYWFDAEFNGKPVYEGQIAPGHYLLLLHGTLSTTVDAFGDLNQNNDAWRKIMGKYGNNVISLEHYTLSESPLKNALDFLEGCPKDCTIDILSHSRGGLVADILAKCDFRNDVVGFSNNELRILKSKDKSLYKLMLAINKAAQRRHIKIDRVVRVASPASGTTILSRRVDHFFNLLLNAVSLAFGIRNPLYDIVKSFLLELISQKEDSEILPGLNSMMPESHFQKMMNASDTFVESNLYTISGDAEIGGVNFDSLKVILANLFYRTANDLVVDTNRMVHGIRRTGGVNKYLSQGGKTNHFRYFTNSDSCDAILQALYATSNNPASSFDKHVYTEGERGVLLAPLSLQGISFKPDKITRDVIIVIPGIMGSSLATDGEEQWVDMPELNKGAIVKNLSISENNVEPTGVIKKFYKDIGDYFSNKYDVISLEFDWRKSLKDAAITLKGQLESIMNDHVDATIHIVAHSMGGLVVRQCMMDFNFTWKEFTKNKNNKFVMLGTPWLGSYLIMEVLTGHSRRVKQLAAIDFRHDRGQLLDIFWKYPGVFELLPIDEDSERDFGDAKFWENLDEVANLKHMPSLDDKTNSLKHFKKYRRKVLDFLNTLNKDDFKNIYYICGKADETVFDYKLKSRFLSHYKKLVYTATSNGDGSVTWKTGIPEQLKSENLKENLYYSTTTHGELANEEYIFEAISEILKDGKTGKLSTRPPAARSGEVISEKYEYSEPLYDSNAVVKAIFDVGQPKDNNTETVNVSVINGDLKWSSYPVMVGHFFMDLIISAEKALDGYLDGRLSQRLNIGYYPGKIGESEVFFNLKTQPRGAIVCGLGTPETLTPFLLSKTVDLAVRKYAMFMRDNYTLSSAKEYATGISFILMGIGYGKIPIEDSLKGILLGVTRANKYIKNTNEGLKLIKDIEIINYYESFASDAYISLSKMLNSDNRIPIKLNKGIIRRAGAKKKQLFAEDGYPQWYNLHIDSRMEVVDEEHNVEEVTGFTYYSSSGLARTKEEMVGVGLHKINYLLETYSLESVWNRRISKSLFEMLVPNEFKDIFRTQSNMILKLDKDAAELPWELFHDSNMDDTPSAVNSGFLRQLVTGDSSNFSRVGLNNRNALIVGDPEYNQEDLSPLHGAKIEAEWVAQHLTKYEYRTNSLINENASNIMLEFFTNKYKIMHFAGHGLYEPEKGNIGIAIGDGICIDPAMINQLGYVPEFVFINCCYSGTTNAEDDRYTRSRYKLAANIGTQLIEMGVRAIIIAGWAVNDAAAKTFAETFYKSMFQDYDFGSSVQRARLACYQNHPRTSTWGAYQCYGNQFYSFNTRKNRRNNEYEYVIASQVHTDLDNLLVAIRDREHDPRTTLHKLDEYLGQAERANLLDAVVLEKEALIYDELGESEIAFQKFKELFLHAHGNFSIEALEKYCVIKSVMLEKATLEVDLQEIQNLVMVGRNPSRLNIVGNAYKLASQHVNSKDKPRYLKDALDYYQKSLHVSEDRYSGDYLDALTNIIFIGHILESLGEEQLIDRIQGLKAFENVTDIDTYLQDFHKELTEYDKVNLDVSIQIGMAETEFALMLLQANFKDAIEVDIIEQFKHVFGLMYSPRYIQLELVQINFLRHYLDENPVVSNQLNKIEREIKKLIEHTSEDISIAKINEGILDSAVNIQAKPSNQQLVSSTEKKQGAMKLSEFMGQFQSGRSRGNSVSFYSNRTADRFHNFFKNEPKTEANLATVLWHIIQHSPVYSKYLIRHTVGKLEDKIERFIINANGSYNLLILDPNHTSDKPEVISVKLTKKQAAECYLAWKTNTQLSLKRGRIRNRITMDNYSRLSNAVEDDFAYDVLKNNDFHIVIIGDQIKEFTLGHVSKPALGVSLTQSGNATSSAGAFATDANGNIGITVSHHALSNNGSVQVGKKIWVGGDLAKVTSVDVISDSCFAVFDDQNLPMKYDVGLKGPLSGQSPRQYDNVEFDGLSSGLTNSIVQGWSMEIPFVQPYTQLKVITDPDTNPGDSGAALIDQDDHILGFAFYRTGVNAKVQYATWIWADSVFKAHNIV